MKKKKEKNSMTTNKYSVKTQGAKPLNKRSKIMWSVLFVAIAAATIWAVISNGEYFSAQEFREYVAGTSKGWLIAALISMLGFVVFEKEAVSAVCRGFGYPTGHGQGLIYSTSDIYFSAITPSASGGQPASAYFMIKDGIPASVTTIVLLINLTMYTLSILVISFFVAIVKPGVFMSFGSLSRLLIVCGTVFQVLLIVFFLMLLMKGDVLYRICRAAIRFLCRIKLMKNEREKERALKSYVSEYIMYYDMIKKHKRCIIVSFIFNMLQRISIISVSLFVFLAQGGSIAEAAEIWAVQSYVVIGSNAVPIPGAMGVSDYIMLDGFGRMMSYQNAVNFELLSRSISFYVCILLCGAAVLLRYLIQKRRRG